MSQTKAQLFDVSVEGPTALKNGAFDVTLGAGGNVTISDGNLVLASGRGIDFSATGDGSGTVTSELLDDYEEGTWTPVLGDSGGTSTHTFTVQEGRYTKIGNQVNAWARCQVSAVGTTGSGILVVRGFPFVALDPGSQLQAGVAVTVGGFTDDFSPVTGAMLNGTSQFALRRFSDAYYRTGTIGPGRVTATSDVIVQVSYTVS